MSKSANPNQQHRQEKKRYPSLEIPGCISGISLEELQQFLFDNIKNISERHYSVAPTSFDSHFSTLSGFPRNTNWQWNSLEYAFQQLDVRGVIVCAPLFWQLSNHVNTVCRSTGIPFFLNDPENIPVGIAALVQTHCNVVVAEPEIAAKFALSLTERNLPHPHWIVIHRPKNTSWGIPKTLTGNIYQEVHLFPGVPIFEQCEELAKDQSGFHSNKNYKLEVESKGTYITSKEDDSIISARILLPFRVSISGTCSCGRDIVTRV